MPEQLDQLVRRLADRDASRSEATIQADVRGLLLAGGLNLTEDGVEEVNLETPVGVRRRIDVEVGATVIEIKKDLRSDAGLQAAITQLAGYVRDRTADRGQRYVGILTDGASWKLYHLLPSNELQLVSELRVDAQQPDVDALLIWLEGVLATLTAVAPSPAEIERRLGSSSSAFILDRSELEALYQACHHEPEVQLKRELYAKLLTTAFGTQFDNPDRLFVDHTLLVTMAKLIAHVVLGVRITDAHQTPERLLEGAAFSEAGIGGVVEADFFDWMLSTPAGTSWVRSLARRIGRFDWTSAEHDVLKVLYESIIDAPMRHRLGEYYTPDWLAQRVVRQTLPSPIGSRCADVSCGSGTFLFHAVRHYLSAADAAGISNRDAVTGVVGAVFGVDVHPVAVSLARVTYLLALGPERLQGRRDAFSVPVYLGDAVQWRHEHSLFGDQKVAVRTDGHGGTLWASELAFPESILADADKFDRLVGDLSDRATSAGRTSGETPDVSGVLETYGITGSDGEMVNSTFAELCRLCDEGRDHIWGYYVRNLVRPVWLAEESHRVDALVGNPPWLSYRYMTPDMQSAFRSLSEERGLWAGAEVATHQDLSALFVVRAIELYLKNQGRFGYVVPEAVLSRRAYAGFRSGSWESTRASVKVTFGRPWSFGGIKPPVFRVPSCVVRGRRIPSAAAAKPMPTRVAKVTGRRPNSAASWDTGQATLSITRGHVRVATDEVNSVYESSFTQGATLVPRFLAMVVDAPAVGSLGVAAGRRRVISRRDAQEKAPWKDLPPLTHAVEPQFIWPVHLGRTLLPFRLLEPLEAVIPWANGRLLTSLDVDLARFPGIEGWTKEAERVWETHRRSARLSLADRFDYQGGLRKQFPIAEHRVLYPASGQYLAGAKISGARAIIDTKLYWASCDDAREADYLAAIFNAPVTTQRLVPLQSRGEHNPRDFHKIIFSLPIPKFDPADDLHLELAKLGTRAEQVASTFDVEQGMRFEWLRGKFRDWLEEDGVLAEINRATTDLLGDE